MTEDRPYGPIGTAARVAIVIIGLQALWSVRWLLLAATVTVGVLAVVVVALGRAALVWRRGW